MTTLLAFVATLAILIVFHEFGHYLIARLAGVKVLRFLSVSAKSSRNAPIATALNGRWRRSRWAVMSRCWTSAKPRLSRLLTWQTFNRKSLGARSAIVAAGPFGQFPARHPAVLGAVHDRRADTQTRA
jgi:regulator of sigma E protease